jgi:hypothetical protein
MRARLKRPHQPGDSPFRRRAGRVPEAATADRGYGQPAVDAAFDGVPLLYGWASDSWQRTEQRTRISPSSKAGASRGSVQPRCA